MEAGQVARFIYIACAFVIFAAIAKCVKNVFFHPLRNFPGPLLGRASRVQHLYHQLKGTLPFHVKSLHDRYGGVVRIAPDELSYNTSEAWQDIYGHRSAKHTGSFAKDPNFYGRPERLGIARSIVSANDEDHRRMRRLQSHAFSEKALYAQESILNQYVDLLINRLWDQVEDAEVKGNVDMVRWFNFTTFDVIGDLAFGRSFDCLETGEMHGWVRMIFKSLKIFNAFQLFNRLPAVVTKTIRTVLTAQTTDKQLEQFRFAADTARHRVAQGPTRGDGRKDFMSYILGANDEKGMTQLEVEASANVFIIAGSETTATLLSGATYHLLKNPEVLSKVTHEVRSSFSSEAELDLRSLAHLPYLSAVFEEALRIYPPAPTTLPRLVPEGGEVIAGQRVAGNMTVGVNHWSTYHSASNFHLPDSFIPERWLGDSRFDGDDKKAFQPFSFGPRNCIGRNLAYSEMRLILGRLLWNFDLELQPESDGWAEKQLIFVTWEKGELRVVLKPVREKAVQQRAAA